MEFFEFLTATKKKQTVVFFYTLNYLGSGMGAPQGSGGQRSEMVG